MRPADSERSTKRDILTKANNVFSRARIPVVCFTALAVLVFGCRMLEAQSARQVHGHETVAQSDIQLDEGLHASGKKHPSPPVKPISIRRLPREPGSLRHPSDSRCGFPTVRTLRAFGPS